MNLAPTGFYYSGGERSHVIMTGKLASTESGEFYKFLIMNEFTKTSLSRLQYQSSIFLLKKQDIMK